MWITDLDLLNNLTANAEIEERASDNELRGNRPWSGGRVVSDQREAGL
jgi:hypothetical protein